MIEGADGCSRYSSSVEALARTWRASLPAKVGISHFCFFLGFRVLWAPKKWEQHIFIFWWWHLVTMPCRPLLNPLADRLVARIMKCLGSIELYLVKETNSGGHHTLTIRFLLYGAVITAWVWPLLQIKPCRRFWKIGGERAWSSAVKRNYVDRKGGNDKKTDW